MNNTSIKKLNYSTEFDDYYLTQEEDASFMANIDADALEIGIEKSEEDIAIGRVLEFREAMAQIDKEVFGE